MRIQIQTRISCPNGEMLMLTFPVAFSRFKPFNMIFDASIETFKNTVIPGFDGKNCHFTFLYKDVAVTETYTPMAVSLTLAALRLLKDNY